MRIPPRYRRDKAEKRHRERGSGRRPDAGGLCRGGEGAIQRGERQPHAQRELKTHGVVDRQAVLVGESQRRPPDAGRGYRVDLDGQRHTRPHLARGREAPGEGILGRVARGEDPAGERAEARNTPTLADTFETYLAANPNRAARTVKLYRQNLRVNLGDWLARPLDAISRQDVEDRFNRITARHGWAAANQTISMLRSVYRRPCVDREGLRNPVELWLAAGGRFNRQRRRRISAPAVVLPRWRAGIEAAVPDGAMRDIFLIGLYTGMRLGEIVSLRWERVDLEARILRVEETKTGEPLELPITRQLAAVFARRQAAQRAARAGCSRPPGRSGWATSSAWRNITARSPRRAGRGSGSTGFATRSSRWRSAS